jgi:hypothetical protein
MLNGTLKSDLKMNYRDFLSEIFNLNSRNLSRLNELSGSRKVNAKEPKTCLGQVFNFKLGCFDDVHLLLCGSTPTSIVENSAQV